MWTVDLDTAHEFRDYLLYLMEEHVYQLDIESEKLDRWGLLRQIDEHREEAIKDLKTGETVISVFG